MSELLIDEHEPLPKMFDGIEDRFFCPEWWSMDGQAMAVFCIDIQKSIRAHKVIMEESYCMTRYLNGMIEENGRVLADHKWEAK